MAKYQITKKIKTGKSISDITEIVGNAFRNISEETIVEGSGIKAVSIDATFGSINRSDVTIISIVQKEDGYLLLADTNYKPSVMFWVFLAINGGLMAAAGAGILGHLLVFYFYFTQKKRVINEVERALNNVMNLV